MKRAIGMKKQVVHVVRMTNRIPRSSFPEPKIKVLTKLIGPYGIHTFSKIGERLSSSDRDETTATRSIADNAKLIEAATLILFLLLLSISFSRT